MPNEVVDSSQLANIAAQRIALALTNAVEKHGAASLALAGGTTPRAAYEALADISSIGWERIQVYFGDERAVPPDHPDSNFNMARLALFERVPLPAANIHRLRAEAEDRDAAARDYEAVLPERLSVLILGIGEDGHTASLFPGNPALHERTRRVLPVTGPKPPPERLTITAPVIENAELCIVLASGTGKAEAVYRALLCPPAIEQTPACLAREGLWLLDPAAAARLS